MKAYKFKIHTSHRVIIREYEKDLETSINLLAPVLEDVRKNNPEANIAEIWLIEGYEKTRII